MSDTSINQSINKEGLLSPQTENTTKTYGQPTGWLFRSHYCSLERATPLAGILHGKELATSDGRLSGRVFIPCPPRQKNLPGFPSPHRHQEGDSQIVSRKRVGPLEPPRIARAQSETS